MSIITIPIAPGSSRSTVSPINLDSKRIVLRLRVFGTDSVYRMWTFDDTGESLICGPIKLVPGLDLWRPYRYDGRLPQGTLFVYSPAHLPATADTADNGSWLYYRPV